MSVADLVGQMSQIDINIFLDKDNNYQFNHATAERFIGEMGIGSVLNLPQGGVQWSATDFRTIAIALDQIAAQYNRPPIIWGLDSVHGANYVQHATIAPQPLNIAATFNVTNAYATGVMASRDTRAAGLAWLFSPLVGIATVPQWSRVYETFGEDPTVVGSMAAAMIQGIQQPDTASPTSVPHRAAASAKHFVGYPHTRTGHDRAPAWIPTRHLYQYFVPPWKHVMDEAKPMTVMESYSEVDGVPMVVNGELLQHLLRDRLGFDGTLVTDYEEIYNAWQWHHVASTKAESVVQALAASASLDMSMIPWDVDTFSTAITEAIAEQRLDVERLKISARRVLDLKEQLGLMDNTLTIVDPNLALVGSDRERVYSGMVHDSLILAENKEKVLPLDPNAPLKLLVTGPAADSMGAQSGGWTRQWQGTDDRSYYSYGDTTWERLKTASKEWEIAFRCGVDILGNDCSEDTDHHDENMIEIIKHWTGLGPPSTSIAMAVQAASTADVTIICLGEEPNAEKPGDVNSLRLPAGQYNLVEAIRKNTSTKVVLVFFGGRPLTLPQDVDTVLLGFLPGPDAGRAVVDIVTGAVNPSGRLPITYPSGDTMGGLPYYHAVSDKCTHGGGPLPHYDYGPCDVAWPFGHGLSYTEFSYSDFVAVGGIDEDLSLSVTVKNIGNRDGADAVMFFTFDEFRPVTPEYKRLRAFEKIYLKAGESTTVKKVVPVDDLRFVGPDSDKHYILDPTMVSFVGVGSHTDCRARDEHNDPIETELCVRLQSRAPTKPYFPICDAACELWEQLGCYDHYGLSNASCHAACSTANASPDNRWDWNYVECLENLSWRQRESVVDQQLCWQVTNHCRNVFATPTAHHQDTPNLTIESPSGASLVLALGSSIFAAVLFCLLVHGRFANRRSKGRKDNDSYASIQFTTLQNGALA